MNRVVTGLWRGGGNAETRRSRVAAALHDATPDTVHTVVCGPLVLAFTGMPPPGGDVLCLLDGRLDDAASLAGALGLAPDTGAEAVITAAYRRWGDKAFAHLRGDFVVVLADARRGETLLVRDRMGGRALHVANIAGGVAFGSEVRDVLALLPTTPAPDQAAVLRWLASEPRADGDTLLTGVTRVPPATLVGLGGGGAAAPRAYWTAEWRPAAPTEGGDAVARIRTLLDQAVTRRIDGHGSVGVLLSGGLDSSAVAALGTAAAPGRVRAYSATFPGHPRLDEGPLVDEVLEHLRMPGARIAAGGAGGMVADALRWTAAWRMPALGWGDFWEAPLWRQAARDGAAVMLTGDGGDELFGARPHVLADHVARGRAGAALSLARRFPGAGSRPPIRPLLALLVRYGVLPIAPAPLLRARDRARATQLVPAYFDPGAARRLAAARDSWAWKQRDGPLWWRWIADVLTRLIEGVGVLDDVRLRGRLHGVTARQPLFDADLVECLLALEPEHFLDPHRDRPLLRDAMRGTLPRVILGRRDKSRFDPVLRDCLTGGDAPAVRRLLDHGCLAGDYVDRRRIRTDLLDAGPMGYRDGSFPWTLAVWRLLALEIWLRTLADGGFADRMLAERPPPGVADLVA